MITRSWGFSVTFGALLLLACGTGTLRADVIYGTGKPAGLNVFASDGVDDVFHVTIGEISKKITIHVDSTDSAITKAGKLAAAINDPVNGFGLGSAERQRDNHGLLNNMVKVGGGVIELQSPGDNKSGEGHSQLFSSLLLPDGKFPYYAVFAVAGPIAGTDVFGAQSIFSASFGWDGFSDDFTSTFARLSAPTPDGLLSDMYSQLLAGLSDPLRGNLILDTANEEILFRFPDGQQHYFETSASTDKLIGFGSGFQPVPEPSSGFLVGALVFIAVAYRNHPMSTR